jgi:adenylate cyclase
VSGYTRQQVAQRAGVDPDYLDRLVELGILTPAAGDAFSPGDALRARWVQSLERAGVPLEGMAAAVRDGALSFSFMDVSAFDRFAGLSGTTFQELSARTGIPLELLMVVREAVGFAAPRPEDRVREDELSVVSAIEAQLSEGFRSVVIEGWLRVCGDSLRRIAETETAWWHSEVMMLLASGMTEAEMLQAQADLGSQVAPLTEQALLAIYHGQQEHAWTQGFVGLVEGALDRAGLYRRLDRPPAVCFLDLTGYTRLTEERGDEAAAEVAARLATLVRRSAQEHGGTPVKWLGDGVMFYFRAPAAGVLAALEMVEAVGRRQGLPPAHVGIHAGPVVFQDGDYFGRTVNLAARIGEYARPGEVLVSQEVVDAAEGGPVTFTEVGPVELKGVPGPLRLHIARRSA